MPKRSQGFAGVKDRVVRVPFRVLVSTSISKSADTRVFTELEVLPANLGSRVSAMSTSFEYYRVTQMTLSAFSTVGNAVHYDSSILNVTLGTMSGYMAIAYEPSDTTRTGVPTTIGQMANAAVFDTGSFHSRFSVTVPRSVLMGAPLKWWNTTSTGSPTETLVQGLIWGATSNLNENNVTQADLMVQLVSGIIEFKGMIDPALAAADAMFGPRDKPVLESKSSSVGAPPRSAAQGRADPEFGSSKGHWDDYTVLEDPAPKTKESGRKGSCLPPPRGCD